MRFYEINPDDEGVARKWFTYLSDSKAKIDVALGDARIVLERELKQGSQNDYDVIVVDAVFERCNPDASAYVGMRGYL